MNIKLSVIFLLFFLFTAHLCDAQEVVIKIEKKGNPFVIDEVFYQEEKEVARLTWEIDNKSIYKGGEPRRLLNSQGTIPDGNVNLYYPSGKLAEVRPYRNNQINGDSKSYFKFGGLKDTTVWVNDERMLMKVYDVRGFVKEEVNFYQKRPHCYKRFDEEGNILKQGCY